jgi:hypothetical protein
MKARYKFPVCLLILIAAGFLWTKGLAQQPQTEPVYALKYSHCDQSVDSDCNWCSTVVWINPVDNKPWCYQLRCDQMDMAMSMCFKTATENQLCGQRDPPLTIECPRCRFWLCQRVGIGGNCDTSVGACSGDGCDPLTGTALFTTQNKFFLCVPIQ